MTATLVGVAVTEGVFGGVLLSHPVPRAVPSAQAGLASGFGMGPGVSPPLWPPKLCRTVNTAITFPRPVGWGVVVLVVREPHSGREQSSD